MSANAPSVLELRASPPCGPSISYLMSPDPGLVRRAREHVREALPILGLLKHGELAELAELIVSELVTNAIVHGGTVCGPPFADRTAGVCPPSGLIEVRLSLEGGSLRVYVHDQGDGRPVRRHPADDWERGRGLELIDGFIELYGGTRGVVDDGDRLGKTVYVTLPVTCHPEGTR